MSDYTERLMDAAGEGLSAGDAKQFAGSGLSRRFLGEIRDDVEDEPETEEPATNEP